jgi:hypothetical protein
VGQLGAWPLESVPRLNLVGGAGLEAVINFLGPSLPEASLHFTPSQGGILQLQAVGSLPGGCRLVSPLWCAAFGMHSVCGLPKDAPCQLPPCQPGWHADAESHTNMAGCHAGATKKKESLGGLLCTVASLIRSALGSREARRLGMGAGGFNGRACVAFGEPIHVQPSLQARALWVARPIVCISARRCQSRSGAQASSALQMQFKMAC